MTRTHRAVVVGFIVLSVATPAQAQTEPPDDRIAATRVVLEPSPGTRIVIADRLYAGSMTVTAHSGGLALVEEVTVDDYLLGIREVPFSWHPEALAAQVVAARSYLAWTIHRGRSPNGRAFGYDICATTACQVYAGVGGLSGSDGRRWVEAVRRTSGEILVTGGSPVQALYSSTSDGRTRNVEDVFPGASPDPHLRAVSSPGETSPFVSWEFVLTARQASSMFAHAGLLEGRLLDVTSRRTEDGGGPWMVTVHGSNGDVDVDTWTLRTRLNRAASALYPDQFPVHRPDSDRRYPQTIMSPNYTIESELFLARPADGPMGLETRFRVAGGGWGHLVGMSQYGAQAMAEGGSDYPEILAHYYGGALPEQSQLLEDRIRVGLGTELAELEVVPDGALRVVIDGEEVSSAELGSWTLSWDNGVVIVHPPEGLGLPPQVGGWQTLFDSHGIVELVTVRSRTAAEVRVVVREGRVVIADSGWEIREAGIIAVDLDPRFFRSAITIEVTVRSPLGEDSTRLRILSGAE